MSSHWVESLFPARYSIGDYRASFVPDHKRVRRYITTLSAFDAPTLTAIYEQSYLFSLIQRLAQQEEESKTRTTTTRSNQTEPIDSVLDIRLIREFLEKHKEKEISKDEDLWSSDELATIRGVYLTVRDDCLRYKSENDYFREQIATLEKKFDETIKTLETLQNEHRSLHKTHERWRIRANVAEQLVDEQRRELNDFVQHVEELTKQNENFRRDHLQMQALLLERHTRVEHLERKIHHYDETFRQDCDRQIQHAEKRAQIDKDRHNLEKTNLQTKLDKEQELRRQNLLALDQLRKHVALPNTSPTNEQSFCDIKHVKFV